MDRLLNRLASGGPITPAETAEFLRDRLLDEIDLNILADLATHGATALPAKATMTAFGVLAHDGRVEFRIGMRPSPPPLPPFP